MKTTVNRSKKGNTRQSRKSAAGAFGLVVGRLRLLLRWTLVVAVILAAWFVYMEWKVQSSPHQTLPEQADVGIVLGASLRKDLPSPGLKERLDLAYSLYQQGKFQKIIVSGGLDHNGSKLTEAEGMRNYLAEKGIPQDQILLEPKATSTYENLLYSKEIMDKLGLVSSIVITHTYHGSRSLDIAQTVGLKKPVVATTDSEVLFMPYHEARETLAYTKWIWTKIMLKVGI
ncbi:YdcF family protein [Paenibacillus hexagrammi]|uniref:YdcF family protein n=1 Tax=Paenibacillus hexagrammi TaxID=2908839 RepID=A0ABY3SPV4_9BACL|nr:YdcF family protein [Paenibacillus sp. YPD9-1]UJF36014.1 YdcF family protein [Paenibacillus sp. YPD9-1]